MAILDDFGKYSGYKLNMAKTQILTFNYSPNKETREKYKIKWKAKVLKYLGVTLTKTLGNTSEINYKQVNKNIETDGGQPLFCGAYWLRSWTGNRRVLSSNPEPPRMRCP